MNAVYTFRSKSPEDGQEVNLKPTRLQHINMSCGNAYNRVSVRVRKSATPLTYSLTVPGPESRGIVDVEACYDESSPGGLAGTHGHG